MIFIVFSSIALNKNWNNKKIISIFIYAIAMLIITFFVPTKIEIEHKYFDNDNGLLPSGNWEYRKEYNIYLFLLDSTNGPQPYY